MPQVNPQQAKLLNLLRELFQLNQPDLDFGLYRIMHAKSQEIEQFLNEDLLATIRQRLGGNKAEKVEKAKAACEREKQLALEYGGNPDTAPKVMQAHAEYKAAQQSADDDEDLYEQLYRFFERYYDNGDFLSRRYYGRETSEKGAPYAVPYDGSEVYLHWANKDQYYIKTTESFRQFSVDLAQAKLNAAELFGNHAPGKLHFTLVEAEEGAHNNVKASNDKERYFIVDADTPLQWQSDELTVRFHYRADEDKPAKGRNWREERNQRNETTILAALAKQATQKGEQAGQAQRYHQALNADMPKGKDGTQKLIAKYLNQYTAKNSMDYFIHKDLGGFLKRELDYYLKNELFRLDELGSVNQPNIQNYQRQLQKALTLREIAHKLIAFLAQTEEFQKKLWLKKKFVVETQWLVTLDKVPTPLYPQIEANDAQWAEWEKLGFVALKAKRKTLLTPESKLVLDTQFFDAGFIAQLLEHISSTTGNLDEATDGVLVHSENFQALNLMQEKYRGRVAGIYIDPPYNTDASEIVYKNGYKDSSWCSLIHDRLDKSRALLKQNAPACVTIDECEVSNLQKVIESSFIGYKIRPVIIEYNHRGRVKSNFSITHEYALWALPDGMDVITRKREISDDIRRNLRRTGTDSKRQDSAKQFYGIEVDNDTLDIVSVTDSLELAAEIPEHENNKTTMVWPIDEKGIQRRWYYGRDRVETEAKDGTVWAKRIKGEIQIHYHQDGKPKMRKSVWVGKLLDASTYGSELLNDLFGLSGSDFSFPKSIYAVSECLESMSYDTTATFLDFFSGSGTTAHAVIKINREDEGKRKYILVEMGQYFDTVLKPRIAKVIYSADWKDGKPTAPETGVSQLIKVVRLESYEDTLNNLQVNEQSAQRDVVVASPALREDYFLHYLLAMETQGSPSLLNVAQFAVPTAYTLRVKQAGSDAQAKRTVDLVETFNWLLGLRVSKLFAPQVFAARFTEERDAELGADAGARQVLNDLLSPASGDGQGWWFRTVQGTDADGRAVWVVWRKLTANAVQDNLVLEAYLREQLGFDVRKQGGAPCAVLYVNGSHALPNILHCEVCQLEDAFHRLMWDVKDV